MAQRTIVVSAFSAVAVLIGIGIAMSKSKGPTQRTVIDERPRVNAAILADKPTLSDPRPDSRAEMPLEFPPQTRVVLEPKVAEEIHSETSAFIPYPNGGVAPFEFKYDGMSGEELQKIGTELQLRLNQEVNAILEDRLARGLFDHSETVTDTRGEIVVNAEEPTGMGKVWRTARHEPGPDGYLVKVVFVTESEYPELFDHRAEYEWVASAWIKTTKNPTPK